MCAYCNVTEDAEEPTVHLRSVLRLQVCTKRKGGGGGLLPDPLNLPHTLRFSLEGREGGQK